MYNSKCKKPEKIDLKYYSANVFSINLGASVSVPANG